MFIDNFVSTSSAFDLFMKSEIKNKVKIPDFTFAF